MFIQKEKGDKMYKRYNLVGQIAEEKELTGEEGIGQLVNKFMIRRGSLSETSSLLLPGMRKEFISGIGKKQKGILKTIDSLRGIIPMPSEIYAKKDAQQSLIEDYICSEFGEYYDLLSNDLFDLRRRIESISEDGTSLDIDIPLFVSVLFGSESVWKYNYDKKDEDHYGSRHNYNVELTARNPPLTSEAKQKAREARANFSEVYAKALKTNVIGDLLMSDIERFQEGGGLDLSVYWIPKPSELDIKVEYTLKDPDPLLVGKIYSRNYLITTWNIRGEEPYEHYLEEFTEKKAGEN